MNYASYFITISSHETENTFEAQKCDRLFETSEVHTLRCPLQQGVSLTDSTPWPKIPVGKAALLSTRQQPYSVPDSRTERKVYARPPLSGV